MRSRSGGWTKPTRRQLNRRELRTLELEAIKEEGGFLISEVAPLAWRSKFAQTLREHRESSYKAWKRCLLSRNGTYSLADLLYTCTQSRLFPTIKKRIGDLLGAKKRRLAMAKKLRKLIAQLPELTAPREAVSSDLLRIGRSLESCAELLELEAPVTGKNHLNRHEPLLPVIAELHPALTYPQILDLIEAAWITTSGHPPLFEISEGSISTYWGRVTGRNSKTARR
jgi:hypothetical protein